jgi:hypothetical protein
MTANICREIETKIVDALLTELFDNGLRVNVNNGGDTNELPEPTRDKDKVMETLFATGEDTILVYTKEGKRIGFVSLVYGNGGWDVISDYATRLEPYMTKANALAEHYSE